MYSTFQPSSVYNSLSTVPFAQRTTFDQYRPMQYVSHAPRKQPMYDRIVYQLPIYTIPTQQQQQYSGYPPYVHNMQMNEQAQPTYQTIPQQPPPAYSTAVQPSSNSTPAQQQPVSNNNPNPGIANAKPQAVPFSKGYKWPRQSVSLVCPNCGGTITTRVESTITIVTLISALLLFFFTVILFFLPFCVPAFKRFIHYCPSCNCILGIRRELQ